MTEREELISDLVLSEWISDAPLSVKMASAFTAKECGMQPVTQDVIKCGMINLQSPIMITCSRKMFTKYR